MTNLTQKEEEEFDKKLDEAHYEWCIGHNEGQYCHLDDEADNDENIIPFIKAYLSQKKAEWQNEVIEAISDTGWGHLNPEIAELKQNLKSQFKGKE